MRKIAISPEAKLDLIKIKRYIKEKLLNSKAAENTIKNIIITYKELVDIPDIGIPVERYTFIPTDIRFVMSKNYNIFYNYDDEKVYIIRILYSRMDFIDIIMSQNNIK